MRQEYDLEKKLKEALAQECEDMTASRDLKDRIDAEILERQKEADMKHFSVKKLIIGVAAGCFCYRAASLRRVMRSHCQPTAIWETAIRALAIWIKQSRSWAIRWMP